MSTRTASIESTPGVCGGKPRIAGTRIRVEDVYVWRVQEGRSAEDIVADHPQLTAADIDAATAYYTAHRDEIDRDMRAAEHRAAALRRRFGPGPLAGTRNRIEFL
jgi:uncharacterized protein (DUF433 family)